MLIPLIGVSIDKKHEGWNFIERITAILFCISAEVLTFGGMVHLIYEMMYKTENFSGIQLLSSSAAAWITNVLVFSIAYWQMDRGGPEGRVNDIQTKPDWIFPQTGVPELVSPDWRPKYVDYLFLSFSTATAFSTTDVTPLTSRAKMLMMFESAVSLTTLVVVASRAINILGS